MPNYKLAINVCLEKELFNSSVDHDSADITLLHLIYLLTAIWLTHGDSSTAHIYTQTVHRTTQLIWEECGPCVVFASYTVPFALQLRKKHGETSVKVAEEYFPQTCTPFI